jgi:pSer/pThr/pTyr-binding forkhead associated (FHA) protein
MARRRRMTRISRPSSRPSKAVTGSDPEEELNELLIGVLEPTCASEEEDEELDLISVRRQIAESVGAPVSTCATLYLHGKDLLFERTSPDCPLIVGRHPGSDLVLTENSVSRRHAELTYRDDAWFIRDLDSTSGTEVNGEAVTGTTRLKEGDQVELGKVALSVSFSLLKATVADEEEPEPPEKAPTDSDAADETPVLARDPREFESAAGVPTIVVSKEKKAKASERSRASQSDRAKTIKRQMEIEERRVSENIKTIGILGIAAVAVFGIVGIISSVNRPSKPATPSPSQQTAEPEASTPVTTGATEPPSEDVTAKTETVGTEAPAVNVQETPRKPVIPPVDITQTPEPAAVDEPSVAEAEADDAKAAIAAAIERLPNLPGPLPAEVSPFEPRWFGGPAKATVVTQAGETMKGLFRIDGDTVRVDAAGVMTTMKLDDIKQLVWDGSRGFVEADGLLSGGDYGRAAEKYAQAIREAETSLRAAGADPATFAGQWYAEGRRRECLLKADHLQFCQAVFNRLDLATPEQLNMAGNTFARLATPGCVPEEMHKKFEALLAEGRFILQPAARDCWVARRKRAEAAKQSSVPEAKKPAVETATVPKPTPETSAVRTPAPGTVPPVNPRLVTLTCVGGPGDQYIHEVGFMPDGTIYGKGTGFLVGYAADGAKCLGIKGNPATPSKDRRGANWANKGTSIVVDGIKLTIGYKQVHAILQQPYMASSAGWKWWGWNHEEAKKRKLMADSRGVALYPLSNGRFLAKCWCDGGNTVLEKDPRNLDRRNPALANPYNRCAAGSASLYIIGDARTGEPLHATWMIHRPQAEAVDAYGRVYIAQQAAKKYGSVYKDSLGLGGRAGISIFNPTLSACLFSGTLGGDISYALAVRDNLLVIGGSVGRAKKSKDGTTRSPGTDPSKLMLRNPAQPKPGGGEDGFLAIFRLW